MDDAPPLFAGNAAAPPDEIGKFSERFHSHEDDPPPLLHQLKAVDVLVEATWMMPLKFSLLHSFVNIIMQNSFAKSSNLVKADKRLLTSVLLENLDQVLKSSMLFWMMLFHVRQHVYCVIADCNLLGAQFASYLGNCFPPVYSISCLRVKIPNGTCPSHFPNSRYICKPVIVNQSKFYLSTFESAEVDMKKLQW
jgi:hypothetical protein